ncbi:MAG: NAD(P)H-binding protein [Gammaproteobacteria bacterium]|nr:NAD(P)H-binding protein [Gammaproteobacteria bacterium]MXZ27540.1 NAD(P)H-binding protein [Gammaproteobacteria bacterium]MYF59798.1 NAD(P)H-binding protein [Gammaproteobacteria bacterium]
MKRRTFVKGTLALTALSTAPWRLRAAENGQKPVIALFGATARSGREIIRQALQRGHTIKGFARTPSKLGVEHENLTLFKGDIYERDTIDPVLEGHEVVVSMIGVPAPEDPAAEIGPVDIYTVMGEHLISAMQEKGNTRLIMASSTGVEHRMDVNATRPPPGDLSERWKWLARHLYDDMWKMEEMIANSGLDYMLLRPGFMVEEPARHDMKFNTTGDTPGARVITYEDFATFILDNLDGGEYWNMALGMYSDTIMDPAAEIEKHLARQKAEQEAAQAKGGNNEIDD